MSRRLLVCVLMLTVTRMAYPAEWSYDTRLDLRGEYDDNWLLTDGDELASAALRSDIEVSVMREVSLGEWTTSASGTHQTFENPSFEKLFDWSAGTAYARELERGSWSLGGEYQSLSSLLSAFDNDGRIALGEESHITRFNSGAEYDLTERSQLRATLLGQRVEYSVPETGARRSDYDLASLELAIDTELSERTTLSIQLLADRFESSTDLFLGFTPDAALENVTWLLGPGVRVMYESSSSLRLEAGLNYRRTRFDTEVRGLPGTPAESTYDNQYFGFVSATMELERQVLELALSRSIQPNSTGALSKRDKFTARWKAFVGERMSLLGEFEWFRDRYTFSIQDRDALSVRFSLIREITRRLRTTAGVRFRSQVQDRLGVDAEGYGAYLSLNAIVGRIDG